MNERDIFDAALAISDSQQRGAFLEQACGENETLRREIEEMLDAQERLGSFLQGPPVGLDATIDLPVLEEPGTQVGPYKLLQQIGEGGFGVVYMAEQHTPVRRKVALKIIKAGMDTRQVIARFEAERQALALMDHHNIARVLDAGATNSGRPYFAMELVKGVPITEYCDRNRLTPSQRLDLFIPICQAVQHAHQKGVIHRDLKPSNVLVSLYDGQPVPKVIDFGIAKATNQQLTEKTMFTEFGQIIGTLEYMSPEQAESSQLDIDTRSDVYSLGVLLYELLTGDTPLSRQKLRAAGYEEMLRMIREDEPSKPSTKVSESGSALPQISAQRQTEPAKLGPLIRGDLDWIVMKSLEKDRTRRYDSANELAQDVARYLNHEPVVASPQSVAYRIRKFARKHHRLVSTGLVMAATLLVATGLSTWAAIRATRAERIAATRLAEVKEQKARADEATTIAKQSQGEAERLRDKAQNALATSEQARRESQRALSFMVTAFESPNPSAGGRKITMLEVLNNAVGMIERDLADDPLTQATLFHTIGGTYTGIGRLEDAKRAFERAFEIRNRHLTERHRDTLNTKRELGDTLNALSELDRARQLLQSTYDQQLALLPENDPDTLRTMSDLAMCSLLAGQMRRAVELLERATLLQMEHLPPGDPTTLETLLNLGSAQSKMSESEASMKSFQKAYEIAKATYGEPHPRTSLAHSQIGVHLLNTGNTKEALEVLEKVHPDLVEVRGRTHDHTLAAATFLASAYRKSGDLEKSVALGREVCQVREKINGRTHHYTHMAMASLATTLGALGEEKEAQKMLVFVARNSEDANQLFRVSRQLTDTKERIQTLERAIARFRDGHGENARTTVWAELELARVLHTKKDDAPAAITKLESLLERTNNDKDGYGSLRGEVLASLGRAHFAIATKLTGDAKSVHLKKAISYQRTLLKIKEGVKTSNALDLATVRRNLGVFLHEAGEREEARKVYLLTSASLSEAPRNEPLRIAKLQFEIGDLLGRIGFKADAIGPLSKSLEIRERHLPKNDRMLFQTMNLLATAHRAAGQYELASVKFEDALSKARVALGDHDAMSIMIMENLGGVLSDMKKSKQAMALFKKALESSRIASKKFDPRTLSIIGSLANEYHRMGQDDKALQLLEPAVRDSQRFLGVPNGMTLRLKVSLSRTYARLGRHEEAIENTKAVLETYEQVPQLGKLHPKTLSTLNTLVVLYIDSGDYAAAKRSARTLYERILETSRSGHPNTLIALSNAAISLKNAGEFNEAVELQLRSRKLHIANYGLYDPRTLLQKSRLGNTYIAASRQEEGLNTLRDALRDAVDPIKGAMEADHSTTLEIRNNLALGYSTTGDARKSVEHWETNSRLAIAKLGENDPRARLFFSNLGVGYMNAGEFARAVKILDEAVRACRANAPSPAKISSALHNLAACKYRMGDLERAHSLADEALKMREKVLGPAHIRTLQTIGLLGRIRMLRNEVDQAIPLLTKVQKVTSERYGKRRLVYHLAVRDLATCYRKSGNNARSVELLRKVLKIQQKVSGPKHPATLATMDELGESLMAAMDLSQANTVLREALKLRKDDQQPWRSASTRSILLRVLLAQGGEKEAESQLVQCYENMQKEIHRVPFQCRERLELTAKALVRIYTKRNDVKKVQEWKERAGTRNGDVGE